MVRDHQLKCAFCGPWSGEEALPAKSLLAGTDKQSDSLVGSVIF